jgi:hypothetical protein
MRAAPHPPVRDPLHRANCQDQEPRQKRCRKKRRPHDQGIAELRPDQHPRAQTLDRAGRQFAHDRADKRRRDGDLQRGKEIGHGRRKPQLEEGLHLARTVGLEEVKLHLVGAAQTLDHADKDREETQVGRDDRLRQIAPAYPQLAGQRDDHRRQRHDGNRLADDRPGHHAHLHHAVADDGHGQPDAEDDPKGKAQHRALEGHIAMIDQTALRGDRLPRDPLP